MDDLLITGNDLEEIEGLKKSLSLEFKMSDMGLARIYLGAKIQRVQSGITTPNPSTQELREEPWLRFLGSHTSIHPTSSR